MLDTDKLEFKPNVVLEQGTLVTYSLQKGRKDGEGEVVEEPAIVLKIRIPIDRAIHYIGVLTRIWKQEKGLVLGLMFAEQLGLLETAHDPDRNGQKAGASTSGLEPITGKKPSKKKGRETART